jgi:hypothetical protein
VNVADTVLCENLPHNIWGFDIEHGDGLCLAVECLDLDGSGIPDVCECDPPDCRVTNVTQGTSHAGIQETIETATHGDEILVSPGSYFETIDFAGKAITLRSTDGPEVTIINALVSGTVVTCDDGEGPDTILEGFTITGGSGTVVGPGMRSGGGMYIVEASPTIIGCVFRESAFPMSGAGIANWSGHPTVIDCAFTGLSGGTDCGGSDGGPEECGSGAAVLSVGGGLTVIGTAFEENSAFNGGGISVSGGDLTLIGCTFESNSGAGLEITDTNAAVMGCTFVDNDAVVGNYGGAMNVGGGQTTVVDCVFRGNHAPGEGDHFRGGGGLHLSGSGYPETNLTVINCLFRGNTSASTGGGMSNFAGNATLIGCTFAGNFADVAGAAIYSEWGASTTLRNCIVWGNSPDGLVDDPDDPPLVTLASYSDIQGGYPGIGNIDANPMFIDPDNGDFRLLPSSSCIDAGDNTAVPEDIMTDLDGNPRFVDDPDTPDCWQAPGTCGYPPVVDMGAYEFQILCPWDLNGNGFVWFFDLLSLLFSWGPCDDPGNCPADFDGNGFVGVMDLMELIAAWGPCP